MANNLSEREKRDIIKGNSNCEKEAMYIREQRVIYHMIIIRIIPIIIKTHYCLYCVAREKIIVYNQKRGMCITNEWLHR